MIRDSKLATIIKPRERDIGGFKVRRALPHLSHRAVGPIVFFDHMGPALLAPGRGIDVRPHPHIGLATVTYLFDGTIQHRDSLGSDQVIEPGQVNWMIAGRGIVHSERTPQALRDENQNLHGIQLWVALPEASENVAPSFTHHASESLPEFKVGDVAAKLLLGKAYENASPVKTHSDLFYLDAKFPKGARLVVPVSEAEQGGFYLVSGRVVIEDRVIESCSMTIAQPGKSFAIKALEPSRLMIIGGKSVGTRHLFWNFVASSDEILKQAKADWALGPRAQSTRFTPVPGDDREFIPLPEETPDPVATPL